MFKAITNLSSAVADITMIAAKESAHQITCVNDCVTNSTRRVAWKAEQIRNNYEQRLAIRNRKPLAIEYIPENQDQ